jgi:hypothetical protein
MLSDWLAVLPRASFTVAVKLKVPAAVGVPEIAPLEDTDNPDGSAPEETLQEYGVVPPDAVSVALYAVP